MNIVGLDLLVLPYVTLAIQMIQVSQSATWAACVPFSSGVDL
jgi:hypothetical protein